MRKLNKKIIYNNIFNITEADFIFELYDDEAMK